MWLSFNLNHMHGIKSSKQLSKSLFFDHTQHVHTYTTVVPNFFCIFNRIRDKLGRFCCYIWRGQRLLNNLNKLLQDWCFWASLKEQQA